MKQAKKVLAEIPADHVIECHGTGHMVLAEVRIGALSLTVGQRVYNFIYTHAV